MLNLVLCLYQLRLQLLTLWAVSMPRTAHVIFHTVRPARAKHAMLCLRRCDLFGCGVYRGLSDYIGESPTIRYNSLVASRAFTRPCGGRGPYLTTASMGLFPVFTILILAVPSPSLMKTSVASKLNFTVLQNKINKVKMMLAKKNRPFSRLWESWPSRGLGRLYFVTDLLCFPNVNRNFQFKVNPSFAFIPLTPKNDKFQPAASPEILHHTV